MADAVLEGALLGGVIVREAARRLEGHVSGNTFLHGINRSVFLHALNFERVGLTGDAHVVAVADALRFERRDPLYLVELMELFEQVADSEDYDTLEHLAFDLAARRAS